MTIQGLGKFSGKTIRVLFQNENVVAHEAAADENTDATKDNIIATTPDIIAGNKLFIFAYLYQQV